MPERAFTLPNLHLTFTSDLLKPPTGVSFPFTDMQQHHTGRALSQLTLAAKE